MPKSKLLFVGSAGCAFAPEIPCQDQPAADRGAGRKGGAAAGMHWEENPGGAAGVGRLHWELGGSPRRGATSPPRSQRREPDAEGAGQIEDYGLGGPRSGGWPFHGG